MHNEMGNKIHIRKEKLTLSEPLGESAMAISSRFVEVFKRDVYSSVVKGSARSIVHAENAVAHDGMIQIGALQYRRNLRGDLAVFRDIYGITLAEHSRLEAIGALEEILNQYATIRTSLPQIPVTADFTSSFRALVESSLP